jgi:hypothetical protein
MFTIHMYTIGVEKDYLRILGDLRAIHVARSETGHNSGETAPEHALQERKVSRKDAAHNTGRRTAKRRAFSLVEYV